MAKYDGNFKYSRIKFIEIYKIKTIKIRAGAHAAIGK
jgi:hypothetical protein